MPLHDDLAHLADRSEVDVQLHAVGVLDPAYRQRLVDAIFDVVAITAAHHLTITALLATGATTGYMSADSIRSLRDLGLALPELAAPAGARFDVVAFDRVLDPIEEGYAGSWALVHGIVSRPRALSIMVTARLIILAAHIDDLTARLIRRRR